MKITIYLKGQKNFGKMLKHNIIIFNMNNI